MSDNKFDLSKRAEYKAWKLQSSRLQYLSRCVDHYFSTPLIDVISSDETMYNEWYEDIGCSAVDIVVQGFHCSTVHRVTRVLDLPCGHGRVLRHLINLFPEAEFHACDLDRSGVDFCRDVLGVEGIYSVEELTAMDFGTTYDLIWVGSLFTHTSRDITRRWLAHLTKFLSPNGIIVATVHGRWCEKVAERHAYINPESWEEILRGYRETGYGYRDYEKTENHEYIAGSYGVSLTTASEILKDVESIDGLRIFSYRERGWADHQDVMVIGKPAYDMRWT